MSHPVFATRAAMHAQSTAWHNAGLRIGLVPTMGALHAGHLSLIDVLVPHADRIIVSIFVNPTQFAAHEDLDQYPRSEAQDLQALAHRRIHGVFMPTVAEMYPHGLETPIVPQGVALGLEAESRPHFFAGVANVVAKLCAHTRADCAAFGEKDYQQLLVIRQMVRALNLSVDIIAGATIREADGLALSSRNVYLTPAQRKIAGQLNRILHEMATSTQPPQTAEQHAHNRLLEAGFTRVDYAVLRDGDTLQDITPATTARRALIAARLGAVRLLDNMPA